MILKLWTDVTGHGSVPIDGLLENNIVNAFEGY